MGHRLEPTSVAELAGGLHQSLSHLASGTSHPAANKYRQPNPIMAVLYDGRNNNVLELYQSIESCS
jgi:hypothetical protein